MYRFSAVLLRYIFLCVCFWAESIISQEGIVLDKVNNGRKLTLGEKIKDARKAAGCTQEELAGYLGVSRQAITKWESDKGLPDIENIKLISKALGVSIDYLLDSFG